LTFRNRLINSKKLLIIRQLYLNKILIDGWYFNFH